MLVLHVLAAWGFIFTRPLTKAPEVVAVSLSRFRPVEPQSLPPPVLPRVTPQTAQLPSAPNVVIVQPPAVVQAMPAPPGHGLSAAPAQTQQAQVSPPPDYLKGLLAHLNAYKNYPYDARRRRQEGIVRLRFRMDRQGHVLSYDVVGGSGSAALDNEARAMILRAEPLPPVPAGYPGDVLDLVVPIVFSLH